MNDDLHVSLKPTPPGVYAPEGSQAFTFRGEWFLDRPDGFWRIIGTSLEKIEGRSLAVVAYLAATLPDE